MEQTLNTFFVPKKWANGLCVPSPEELKDSTATICMGVAFEFVRGFLLLDCYWVGSLDFNFLGNKGVSH